MEVKISPWEGAVLRGKGRPIVKYRDALPWAVQKWLNWLGCCLVEDLCWPKEACVTWGCTLVLPGKYSWTVHVQQSCKNDWTDRDAICGVYLGGPKEQEHPMPRAIFRGKEMLRHAWRCSAVSCAKLAESIEMLFGLWTRVGPRRRVLGGVHAGTIWRIPLNRPRAAALRSFCQITLTTCYLLQC